MTTPAAIPNPILEPSFPADGEACGPLESVAQALRQACLDCGKCVSSCTFLQRLGSPGQVAGAWLAGRADPQTPFRCSLCGLCQATCPRGARPAEFFQAWREAVAADGLDWRPYRGLLAYQRRGARPAFSQHHLPSGCQTVFFPGCALPGAEPELVWGVWRRLAAAEPGLGLVLDCCWRPSAYLGRREEHQAGLGRLLDRLAAAGVRRVWAACPNCLRSLRGAGAELEVASVYEALADLAPPEAGLRGAVSLHDPCVSRLDDDIQAAARRLLGQAGLDLVELEHSGRHTICCGEGGGAGLAAPDLARAWLERRRAEVDGRPLVTYCAGCLLRYRRHGLDCRHVLAATLAPELASRRPPSPPLAYLNRHRLARRLRRWSARQA